MGSPLRHPLPRRPPLRCVACSVCSGARAPCVEKAEERSPPRVGEFFGPADSWEPNWDIPGAASCFAFLARPDYIQPFSVYCL